MIVTPLETLREIPRDHWWQIEMVLLGEYYLYQYKPLGYMFAFCLFQVRVFGSFIETVRIYDAQFLHPIIFPLQTKPLHSKVSVTIYETIYNHGQNILRKIAQSFHSPPPPSFPLFNIAGEALVVYQWLRGTQGRGSFFGTTEYFLIIFVHCCTSSISRIWMKTMKSLQTFL